MVFLITEQHIDIKLIGEAKKFQSLLLEHIFMDIFLMLPPVM